METYNLLGRLTSAIVKHPRVFLAAATAIGFLAGFAGSLESTLQRLTYNGHHPQLWQVLHSVLTGSYINWDSCSQAISVNGAPLIPREQICGPSVYSAYARFAFDGVPTLVGTGLGIGIGAAGPHMNEKEKTA